MKNKVEKLRLNIDNERYYSEVFIKGWKTGVEAQFKADVREQQPKGEWIFNPKDAIDLMFTKPKCSECGFESADGGNFCSNCGADMRGDKE